MIRLGGSTMAGMAYDFITNETLRTEIRQSWQEELALQGEK